MGSVWDESLGRFVPESAPYVPVPVYTPVPVTPSAPVSDPLLDLITAEEQASGGFYAGRADHDDPGFMARVQSGEDRSDDGFKLMQARDAAYAAYLAYMEQPDREWAADDAIAMAERLRELLHLLGVDT